ncbi:MAG: SpoIIE family protein phosphatase [Terriglobales bacterium]|jgi:serine phosphatase RsbU (regulator of sigma subunit)
MRQSTNVGEPKSPSMRFWQSLFRSSPFNPRDVAPPLADPLHCETPVLRHAEIAAMYSGQRVAGDFYEFLRVGPSRMLFVLLDIAGLRADTREVLIAVQKTFRTLAPELFSGEDFNETTAMSDLCYAMNRTIMRTGLRSCPGFIGCYNENLGTVCYANAGHTPGLLRDTTGITLLEATGLPLGLFSHTTQSAAACHLVPGSALVAVSRGIIEADRVDGERTDQENMDPANIDPANIDPQGIDLEGIDAESMVAELGLDGVRQSLQNASVMSAYDLCLTVLQATRQFTLRTPTHNDLTTLALVRFAAKDIV